MLHMSSMTHVYGVGVVCHPRDCTTGNNCNHKCIYSHSLVCRNMLILAPTFVRLELSHLSQGNSLSITILMYIVKEVEWKPRDVLRLS